jgi:hypothetical protein
MVGVARGKLQSQVLIASRPGSLSTRYPQEGGLRSLDTCVNIAGLADWSRNSAPKMGGIRLATVGNGKALFKIDPRAAAEAPLRGRLLRL